MIIDDLYYYDYCYYHPNLGKCLNRNLSSGKKEFCQYCFASNEYMNFFNYYRLDRMSMYNINDNKTNFDNHFFIPNIYNVSPKNPENFLRRYSNFSIFFGIASFFNSVDFIKDLKGCWKVCHSITTTLLGTGIGISSESNIYLPSNRLKISIGLGKYLGISTNGQDVSIQGGASFGIISLTGIPLDISFETICFYVSGKDKNGCPCGK